MCIHAVDSFMLFIHTDRHHTRTHICLLHRYKGLVSLCFLLSGKLWVNNTILYNLNKYIHTKYYFQIATYFSFHDIENMATPLRPFDTGRQKLIGGDEPFPVTDLPNDRASSLWTEIRTTYDLTLPELSALQNHACAPAAGI